MLFTGVAAKWLGQTPHSLALGKRDGASFLDKTPIKGKAGSGFAAGKGGVQAKLAETMLRWSKLPSVSASPLSLTGSAPLATRPGSAPASSSASSSTSLAEPAKPAAKPGTPPPQSASGPDPLQFGLPMSDDEEEMGGDSKDETKNSVDNKEEETSSGDSKEEETISGNTTGPPPPKQSDFEAELEVRKQKLAEYNARLAEREKQQDEEAKIEAEEREAKEREDRLNAAREARKRERKALGDLAKARLEKETKAINNRARLLEAEAARHRKEKEDDDEETKQQLVLYEAKGKKVAAANQLARVQKAGTELKQITHETAEMEKATETAKAQIKAVVLQEQAGVHIHRQQANAQFVQGANRLLLEAKQAELGSQLTIAQSAHDTDVAQQKLLEQVVAKAASSALNAGNAMAESKANMRRVARITKDAWTDIREANQRLAINDTSGPPLDMLDMQKIRKAADELTLDDMGTFATIYFREHIPRDLDDDAMEQRIRELKNKLAAVGDSESDERVRELLNRLREVVKLYEDIPAGSVPVVEEVDEDGEIMEVNEDDERTEADGPYTGRTAKAPVGGYSRVQRFWQIADAAVGKADGPYSGRTTKAPVGGYSTVDRVKQLPPASTDPPASAALVPDNAAETKEQHKRPRKEDSDDDSSAGPLRIEAAADAGQPVSTALVPSRAAKGDVPHKRQRVEAAADTAPVPASTALVPASTAPVPTNKPDRTTELKGQRQQARNEIADNAIKNPEVPEKDKQTGGILGKKIRDRQKNPKAQKKGKR